jgi:hypothetical protein
MQGGRKLSSWNLFVKKVYSEGKGSNKNYSFKQALSDASKRKSEMGSMNAAAAGVKSSKKQRTKKSKSHKRGTRRRRN